MPSRRPTDRYLWGLFSTAAIAVAILAAILLAAILLEKKSDA